MRFDTVETGRQLELEALGSTREGRSPSEGVARPPTRSARRLCAVCRRTRARLRLPRPGGQDPVQVCLACHHAVMRQRKLMRVGVTGSQSFPDPTARTPKDAGLIVPRDAGGSQAKYATLQHRRHRAQAAARRALDVPVADGELVRSAS